MKSLWATNVRLGIFLMSFYSKFALLLIDIHERYKDPDNNTIFKK
jgi:hypothetical protein